LFALVLVLSFSLAMAVPAMADGGSTLEISQPVQVTNSEHYERGQSIVFDGTNYWLFYGRSASCTDTYQTGNPDVYDYALYYKKAVTVADLVNATATAVTNVTVSPTGFYNGETGAAYYDGKVWAFAPIEYPGYPDRAAVYGWYTTDGNSWTAVGPFWGNKLRGSLHHDEIVFNGELWIAEGAADGDVRTRHGDPYDPTTDNWTDSQLGLNLGSGGIIHFFVDNGELYIAGLQCTPRSNIIYKYNAMNDEWDRIASVSSEGWDPTLFKIDSTYVFAQSPWVDEGGGRQYTVCWSSNTLDGNFFDSDSKMVTEGQYGDNTWTDMWPIGFTDQGGNSYLFFTSERNPDNSGSEIAGNIWYLPVDWTVGNNHYTYIQEAIDAASSGDTINVAAGTYTEAILIDKPLTLRGATAGVNKNGYTVPAGYAWDNTVESIINHPNPSGGYTTIVDIVDTDNVTLEGFVVQELNAEANKNSSLLRIYAHTQEISNIVVRNNVIGPNTNTTAQDGAQGRMGLYIVNHPYDDKGVVNSTFSGNKIFDCKGNGNNVFLWSSYYAYGAPGPASMSGTVIEDNEIYGSHRSGIETAGGFSGLTIRNNRIYDNSGLPSDAPDHLKYGNGILLIRGSSDKTSGPTTAYGPENLTIENNEIYNNEKNGIYMGPINHNYTITGNEIYNNGWDAIQLDLEGTYWNPTFEPEPSDWSCYDGSEDIAAHFNNIYGNGDRGVQIIGTPTNGFVLDAINNWWDDASGPTHADNPGGTGDAVSDNVDYTPWLTAPPTHPLEPTIVSPVNGQTEVGLAPTLQGSDYFDYQDKPHRKSQWQIDTDEDFNTVFDSRECNKLEEITVPTGLLTINTT